VNEAEAARPTHSAADRIRETAKWLIASFAAVGTILVAGTQLSSIGSLNASDARFWVALAGVVAALTAVVIAIDKVVDVLVTPPLSMKALAEPGSGDAVTQAVRTKIADDHALVIDGDLSRLYKDYTLAAKQSRTSYDAWRAAPTAANLTAAQLDDGRLTTLDGSVQNVLAVATLLQLSETFRVTKRWIVGATVIAAAGIVVFAAAANPRKPAGPAAVVVGSTVTFAPSKTAWPVIKPRVGPACRTTKFRAVALGTAGSGVDLVTVPGNGCEPVRITVTPTMGSIRLAG